MLLFLPWNARNNLFDNQPVWKYHPDAEPLIFKLICWHFLNGLKLQNDSPPRRRTQFCPFLLASFYWQAWPPLFSAALFFITSIINFPTVISLCLGNYNLICAHNIIFLFKESYLWWLSYFVFRRWLKFKHEILNIDFENSYRTLIFKTVKVKSNNFLF